MAAQQQQQNADDSSHSQTIYNPPAGHTQLYINNIPWSTTTDELSQWFQTKVGVTPTQVNIAVSTFKKSAGRSRGFGFATVPDSYKQKALDLSGAELNGRELSIVEARNRDESQAIKTERREQRAATREQQPQNGKLAEQPAKKKEHAPAVRPARKTFDNATQLYINNLGWDVTVEALTQFFEKHIGTTPVEVEIVSNKFGRFKGSSKGFGFVVVPNDALDKALALNDSEELGRKMYVQVSRPPTERPEGDRAPSTRSRGPRKPRAENGGEQNGNDSRRRREGAEDDA